MDIVEECQNHRNVFIWVKQHARLASERQRASILLACAAGLTQETIAEVVGCSRSTVVRTYRRWREHGCWGLVDKRRFGQPRKPTRTIQDLLIELCHHQPSDYGWARSRWTTTLLSQEVERQLGVELSNVQTYRYLKQTGCRWRRPKPTVDKGPDDADEQLAEMRQRLVWNRGRNEVLLFEDEMKVQLNPKVGADWMPPNKRKKLITPGQNRTAYVAATYNPRTDHMVWAMARSNDSDLLEILLRMVADRYRGWGTIHMVMDNYSTHTSHQTDAVIEEFDGKLKRHFLPTYTPEANPIERVWWDVHDNVTRNHRHDTLDELLVDVYDYLRTRSYEGIEAASLRRQAA